MEQDMNSAQQSASQSISQGLLQDADEQDGDVPSEEYNTPDSQQTSNSYGLRRNRVAQDYRVLAGKRSLQLQPSAKGPSRRIKRRDLKEEEVEAETARLVGLNPFQLEEEEQAMLPKNVNPGSYVKVRNHVLARWRADVMRYLTVEEAAQKILPKYRNLVDIAWRFLHIHGYINFGVAQALLTDQAPSPAASKGSVIIVGAGLAGAAAARQLVRWGFNVLVLEGRSRPGGRVWTHPLEGDGKVGVADLGGAIITGIDGNPLAVLARQLGLPFHKISDRCPLHLPGGQEAPKYLDDQVLQQHNGLLDAADRYREELPPEVADVLSLGAVMKMLWGEVPREPGQEELHEAMMHWHFANVEFANAACLRSLSLRHWDQDDPYEMLGAHVFIPGGNGQLVDALLQDIPVQFDSIVTDISYGSQGVTVSTGSATYQADVALVTVPLGVLKKQALSFEPPLPQAKQEAIQRLGFGVLNKLALLFPYAFWDTGLDTIARVSSDPADAGLFFLFYVYDTNLAGSGAVLAALVSGDAGTKFEGMSVEDGVALIMKVLREAYPSIDVPDPLQAIATAWASDPLSYGSYSSVAVGATGEDYDTLAADLGRRLFFGGEATISRWPATMHGAFLSGMREAAKMRRALEDLHVRKRGKHGHRHSGSQGMLENGFGEDEMLMMLGSEDGYGSGSEEEEEGGWSQGEEEEMEADLGSRGRRGPGRPPARVNPDALAAVDALVQAATAVRRLFSEVNPDAEFGCMSAFYGPLGSSWAESALLRVDMGSGRSGPRRGVCLYLVLGRGQVTILRNTRGGDEARVSVLSNEMGLPLVGRPQLDARVLPLLTAILQAKGLSSWLQLQPTTAPEAAQPHAPGTGASTTGADQPQLANGGIKNTVVQSAPAAINQLGNGLTPVPQAGGLLTSSQQKKGLASANGSSQGFVLSL